MEKEQLSKKDWKKIKKIMETVPPPVIERKPMCYHETIKKIIKDDFMYECLECHALIDIYGSAMYAPETYVHKVLQVMAHVSDNKEVKELMEKLT